MLCFRRIRITTKPTQEGQFQHFLALAKMVSPIPVLLFLPNVPGRTGVLIFDPLDLWFALPRLRLMSRP